jgi:hypothetical protein
MTQSKFPLGWNEERVRRVLAHYESQTKEEAAAEDEAVLESRTRAFIEVPVALIPTVRQVIAKLQA